MANDKTLIDCFLTYNSVFMFVLIYPANTPQGSEWSTANQALMTSVFGEVLPFPGESWYEGEVSNNEISIRGVELDAAKAATIADAFETEGFDVAVDPESADNYLMCLDNGAGKYINLKLRKSTLRSTYYLEGGLGDNPNVDRTTFNVAASSDEVELGDTFTVTVTRGNFVEGDVVFETSNDAAVAVVSQQGDSITYSVVDVDPAFEVTAMIGDGSTFSASVGVSLVPVTWSAEEKALMRANLDGLVLPYAESIKDMEWALVSTYVVGSISNATASLSDVTTVYDDAGWTLESEVSGVYTYSIEADSAYDSMSTTCTVVISEEDNVVYVSASFEHSWSAFASYVVNYFLGSGVAFPFFENTGDLSYTSSQAIFSIAVGAESQTAVSNIFIAGGWKDWGWDDDDHQTGSRWFYSNSVKGRVVARVYDDGKVVAYLYNTFADYTDAQKTTMSDNLDGILLPKIPGEQVTVQYNSTGGYVLAYGFTLSEAGYNAFLTNFYNAGWTLLNAGSYYLALKDSDNGAIIALVYAGDGGSGYVALQCQAYYYADVAGWSDADKTLMESVLGAGNVLPDFAGAWDTWQQEDASTLYVEGYFIDVDALVAAYETEGYVYDDAAGTLTLSLDAEHDLVVTIEVYGGGAVVDLYATVVDLTV